MLTYGCHRWRRAGVIATAVPGIIVTGNQTQAAGFQNAGPTTVAAEMRVHCGRFFISLNNIRWMEFSASMSSRRAGPVR